MIEELIKVSKEITAGDKQAADMGLREYEYAFYTAVANNDSAKELMQQEKLRELAVVLTERVRQNASIDWTIKESVNAKLKVIEGQPPILSGPLTACPFRARCEYRFDACHAANPARRAVDGQPIGQGHDVACHWTAPARQEPAHA